MQTRWISGAEQSKVDLFSVFPDPLYTSLLAYCDSPGQWCILPHAFSRPSLRIFAIHPRLA